MKSLALAVLIAGALCAPLGGCVTPSAPSQVLTQAQTAQRAMLSAEVAFNVAATAELDAKAMGLLTGDKLAKADQLRRDAYQALLALRAVYATGATPNAAGLLILTNQLLVLAGKAPVVVPNIPTL